MNALKSPVCLSCLALRPVALLSLMCCGSLQLARAQEPESPIRLKRTPMLVEKIVEETRKQLPVFLYGDRTSGRTDLDTLVEGNAVLRRGDTVIRADRLEYYQPDDLARARGNVRINRSGTVYQGALLELKVDAFEGFFNETTYQFLKNEAYGKAARIDFVDDKHVVLHDADYSTCQRQPGPAWLPAWIFNASRIRIDYEEEVGVAEGGVLRFKDVPLLPIPAMSFPLTDKRKSGFLPPTVSVGNVNGVEVTQPYYWDIAPNRDATIAPTLMSKRGLNLGTEFRYLEERYRGQARLDFMPSDSLRGQSRWSTSITHNGRLETGLTPAGGVDLKVNLNRASDNDYWRDFSKNFSSPSQRVLANDVGMNWASGDVSTSVRVLKWQTLQDVAAPIIPPYDRLPQLNAKYTKSGLPGGFDASLEGDYTQFSADRSLTLQPNARRSVAIARLSRPWTTPGSFFVPKVQLHTTRYEFDAALANGALSAVRAVPTYSVDSGLILERDASYFGRSFRQTLEPRAFYVYTPFRDQSLLPNYDSGANDFNFASIYSENAFVGNDRIADNNLLTLGVTSRLIDPATGAEAARLGVAQRLRFKNQDVTLPGGVPVAERISDVLLGGAINWNPRWSVDSTVQYNPKTALSERISLGTRYSPGNYRVVSAAYRLQRGSSEQLDIGWQWPLNDLWGDRGRDLGFGQGQGEGRWYSVGRLNYSMQERKMVDAIVGFEYDGGCWLGRAVLERLQRSGAAASERILFQLEFVGFSRLGASPLKTLKENIPRYQYLREQTPVPSRFSNYE